MNAGKFIGGVKKNDPPIMDRK